MNRQFKYLCTFNVTNQPVNQNINKWEFIK